MSDQQVKTLADAMSEAATEVDNRQESTPDAKPERTEKPEKPSRKSVSDIKTLADQVRDTPDKTATADAKPWEAPGWSKMWKEQSRSALEAFAKMPGAEEHLKHLTGELDQTYNYLGQRNQEFAQLNKKFGPVSDLLTQAEQGFTMQGQSLQQGLQQMFAVSNSLASNPDQTLPWLAERYKPRDPAGVLQALSQVWGADLNQIAQSAPWVDPAVHGMVAPLMNRIQQMEQADWQRQQEYQRQQQMAVVNEISAFENATDESGNAKHPYFRDVYDDMVLLCSMGRAKNVAQAYEMATKFHPGVNESKAKQAEQQALAEAARKTANTKQASDASRNVNSSARGNRDTGTPSILEAMKLADRQLGN